jgi:hypothetical protein
MSSLHHQPRVEPRIFLVVRVFPWVEHNPALLYLRLLIPSFDTWQPFRHFGHQVNQLNRYCREKTALRVQCSACLMPAKWAYCYENKNRVEGERQGQFLCPVDIKNRQYLAL